MRDFSHAHLTSMLYQRMIREHGILLMKRDSSDSKFYDLPTPEEVAVFDPTKGECCTVERFRVDLRGFAKSDWNVSAAKIFARDFLEAHPQYKASKLREVENAWTTHVDYLRKVYRAQTSEIQEVNVRKQRNRRKERCAQVIILISSC
jgi:hypothetical protein